MYGKAQHFSLVQSISHLHGKVTSIQRFSHSKHFLRNPKNLCYFFFHSCTPAMQYQSAVHWVTWFFTSWGMPGRIGSAWQAVIHLWCVRSGHTHFGALCIGNTPVTSGQPTAGSVILGGCTGSPPSPPLLCPPPS